MIILWLPMAICSVVLTIVTWILAPGLALLVGADGNLPRRLRWFQTFDATLDEGRKPQYGMVGSDWYVRMRWLQRNPGYGFDYYLLGIKFVATDWHIVRNDEFVFFAYSRTGAFNYTTKTGRWRIKLGWKYWNHIESNNWDRFDKLPICCSRSR